MSYRVRCEKINKKKYFARKRQHVTPKKFRYESLRNNWPRDVIGGFLYLRRGGSFMMSVGRAKILHAIIFSFPETLNVQAAYLISRKRSFITF